MIIIFIINIYLNNYNFLSFDAQAQWIKLQISAVEKLPQPVCLKVSFTKSILWTYWGFSDLKYPNIYISKLILFTYINISRYAQLSTWIFNFKNDGSQDQREMFENTFWVRPPSTGSISWRNYLESVEGGGVNNVSKTFSAFWSCDPFPLLL